MPCLAEGKGHPCLSTDHRNIRFGNRKIGTGHVFVALRFLSALNRGHITLCQTSQPLPFWNTLRARSGVRAPMAGANAAVVGILGAALYDPLWTV